MKKYHLLSTLLLAACLPVFAQQSLKDVRKKSWQSLVYRIPADTAAKYIRKSIASPDHYLREQPLLTAWSDSLDYDALPVGNYLILSVVNNELLAEFFCRSNLQVLPVNNQRHVQLEVKDEKGNYRADAAVWVNNKLTRYDAVSQGYWVAEKKPEEALVKIAVPGDTLFMELNGTEKIWVSGWSQWWKNFSYTKAGYVVSWPVRSVKTMLTRPAGQWFRKRYRRYRNNGYMIFSKPKYLPRDTVKFKAYILGKKGKQYKQPLDVYLEYYDGELVSSKLTTLHPASPGAFIYEFALGDSLDSDRQYTLAFKNKKKKVLLTQSFAVEDYVLDEVASYSLRSEKETYFRNDTLVFFASAKDANGLAVMDGRVNLYVLAKDINGFYKDREFVPDTLWKAEKPLSVNGDTRFEVPASGFPAADLTLNVLAEFRNSNNELQEKEETVKFLYQQLVIDISQEDGWVKAALVENGQPVSRQGWLEKSNLRKPVRIMFPYTEKIDPYASSYDFSIRNDTGKVIASEELDPGDYRLSFSRIQQQDTTGFSLYNPNRIPVHFTVFYGNKVIAKGGDSTEWISWQKEMPTTKAYTVQWQYIWAGEQESDSRGLAVLNKILDTKIGGASTIYPGQTDTITVTVKDYKGRPADNVNLTAVSYNNQFGQAISVPEPPYLAKYKSRRQILRDEYVLDETGFTGRFLLGKHPEWINRFHLDSMTYYRLLFPKEGSFAVPTLISDFLPQVAVHAVQKGVMQEIYLLYINRQLVYYNGVTDKSNYAFSVVPGYTQIGIRLYGKYIEIDSIYLQPFYKHDISFDLDQLPANAVVTERPDHTYTPAEQSLLERSIWQLQNDSRTNYGYVWQSNKLVKLSTAVPHLIGPFNTFDSLQFFKPGDFDFKFPFESGYEYRLTPRMARLERKTLFPVGEKIKLPVIQSEWVLGDTIVAPPAITYTYQTPPARPYLRVNDNNYITEAGKGELRIELPRDSSFDYAVLYRVNDTIVPRVKNYYLNTFYNLEPGVYGLVLVTRNFQYATAGNINIKADGTTCLRIVPLLYSPVNATVEAIQEEYEKEYRRRMEEEFEKERQKASIAPVVQQMPFPAGSSTINGRITDKKGKSPVPGATVYLKGFNSGTASGPDGSFTIGAIKAGNYVLIVSALGYESKEMRVTVNEGYSSAVDIQLVMSSTSLSEVVVVGYGSQSRRSVTGSISVVRGEELTNVLSGRVAGVQITQVSGVMLDSNVSIHIRGVSSISANNKPLYVVNGVPMDELPADFDLEKAQVNVLKDASATAIYGARAANGVVIITTADFMPKQLRDKFRDYAFWQPNLFTDEDGVVKFTVTYPDNITGWQTYVVGMDKKKRITRASAMVKSFKPLLAQLSAPQFLVEGDSSIFIGKTINYTTGVFSIQTNFSVNDSKREPVSKQLVANASGIENLLVTPEGTDTLSAQYTVTTSAGYSDGELRKIPVVRKGINETIGKFWILEKDTVITFVPDEKAGIVTLHAQNNTLDVLLDEIERLKKYPYFCMEQTASKLTGLVMEKKIRQALKQPFTNEKDFQKLLTKLQKAQLYEGGWSWWEGGVSNLAITNYVTRALLVLRGDALVETNIRNALLYLQNQLPRLQRSDRLAALFTLSEADHVMDYGYYIDRLPFDSLSLHQQWEVVKIKQQQKLNYATELGKVMAKKIETMLGGLHWGEESYWWDRNSMATTVLAFRVLEKEPGYANELKRIIQFFLERRKNGHWMNTVESASIVSAILPVLLENNKTFTEPATLQINNTTVSTFPYTITVPAPAKEITIHKTGGGLVYFTAYQEIFNTNPLPVTGKFNIHTSFERSGNTIAMLKAGEKTVLKVKLEVLQDADYVLVEIPIPAGCTYGDKKQSGNMHREFLKEKAVFFIERLAKGEYEYEIELEPRYAGTYTLNPAKAELMYFPVFYGRNEMKKTTIRE